ncbi:MAG: ChbG/HpnK family deacetylase [Planctomycetaceae bacterium]|nr:ChbG/HpnK family deacetylase [Planctomycetaceae bacterium]
MNRKIIINADDAGISAAVNESIFLGAKAGVITAASIMPNMPFAEDAVVTFSSETPMLSLGLHFCLTGGRPVSPPESVPLLIDEAGVFRHGFAGLWHKAAWKKNADFLHQVRTELLAQLDWFEERQIRIAFLDSHRHFHVIPEIFGILAEESRKRGLFLRIPREKIGSALRMMQRFPYWLGGGLLKQQILNRFSSMEIRKTGFSEHLQSRINYFGVLDTGKVGLNAWRGIFETAKHSPATTILVNIHPSTQPALTTSDIPSGDMAFHRSVWRRREFDAVMSDEFRVLCRQHGFEPASF